MSLLAVVFKLLIGFLYCREKYTPIGFPALRPINVYNELVRKGILGHKTICALIQASAFAAWDSSADLAKEIRVGAADGQSRGNGQRRLHYWFRTTVTR